MQAETGSSPPVPPNRVGSRLSRLSRIACISSLAVALVALPDVVPSQAQGYGGGLFEYLARSSGGLAIERSEPRVERVVSRRGDIRLTVRARKRLKAAKRREQERQRLAKAGAGAISTASGGATTMCVRLCDGYMFPVGVPGGDLSVHNSVCQAACPGAETRLYTPTGARTDDGSTLRSTLDGSLYGQLRTALLFRSQRVAGCSCQNRGNVASPLPLRMDRTLQAGDVVIDDDGGPRVFAGGRTLPHPVSAFPDDRTSKLLSRSARLELTKLVGARQRTAAARAAAIRKGEIKVASAETFGAVEASTAGRATGGDAAFREVRAPSGSARGVRVLQFGGSPAGNGGGAQIIVVR